MISAALDATVIVAECVDDETYAGRRIRALVAFALGTTIWKLTFATRALACGVVAPPPPPEPQAGNNAAHSTATADRRARPFTTTRPRTSS